MPRSEDRLFGDDFATLEDHHIAARDMLHYLRISGVSFAELQQADTEQFQFLPRLMAIGSNPIFHDRFISPPVVSATSSEDSQDNFAGRGQRAAAGRQHPRDENEDPDARPRRRRRQE